MKHKENRKEKQSNAKKRSFDGAVDANDDHQAGANTHDMDEDSDDAQRKVIAEFKARRLVVDALDNFSTADVFLVCPAYTEFDTVSLS